MRFTPTTSCRDCGENSQSIKNLSRFSSQVGRYGPGKSRGQGREIFGRLDPPHFIWESVFYMDICNKLLYYPNVTSRTTSKLVLLLTYCNTHKWQTS